MNFPTLKKRRWHPLLEFRAFTNNDELCEECGRRHAEEVNGFRLCPHCLDEFTEDIRSDALEDTYY